ncbi:MAG: ATP-binding protein [Pirellulaceae bacterium]
MRRLSIRWRITLWNTLAFAVILIGFGITVFLLLLQTHYQQVDRQLSNRLERIQQDPQLATAGVARLETLLHEHGGHTHSLGLARSEAGQWVGYTNALTERDLAALGNVNGPAPVKTMSLPDYGRARVLSGTITVEGEPLELLLLADLEHMDEEMALVLWSLLGTTPVAILLAAAVAYFLARQSLAPVQQLRRRTDQINAQHLSQRLPVSNPHDELGLLAQTINSMIGRLERSFQEIQRFTADASHELRTPIAVIRSEAELGHEHAADNEKAQQRFSSILEECGRLGRLTEQLLALCREDAGVTQMNFAEVDLAEVVSECVEAMRPLADEKQQQLLADLEVGANISGDAQRLRQLTINLIDNAIKYTPQGGQIEVTLKPQGNTQTLTVSDTGIGIPTGQAERIFERFYRVPSTKTQKQEGSGLGLCIVQSIATAHGAPVVLQSEGATGSTFMVHFPRSS